MDRVTGIKNSVVKVYNAVQEAMPDQQTLRHGVFWGMAQLSIPVAAGQEDAADVTNSTNRNLGALIGFMSLVLIPVLVGVGYAAYNRPPKSAGHEEEPLQALNHQHNKGKLVVKESV
jgi:hypothetical protein